MCEHCGCMSLRTVAELAREHDAAFDHIRDARWALATGDAVGAAVICAELQALLGPHSAVEEEALFPPMAEEYPDHVGTLAAEHEAVHAVLAEVAASAADPQPGWEGRLQHTLDVLREHIVKEQDGLFPAALISLSSPDWEHAEQVRARVGSALEGHATPV